MSCSLLLLVVASLFLTGVKLAQYSSVYITHRHCLGSGASGGNVRRGCVEVCNNEDWGDVCDHS